MADIFIEGYITPDAGMFTGERTFSLSMLNAFIADLPSDTKELNVHINSGGGSVTEGFAIYDKLVSLPFTVNTIVEGLCGSIATVIAQAGKKGKRTMFQNGEYFVHNPLWIPGGPDAHTKEDLAALQEGLVKAEQKILDFYIKTTGSDREVLAAKMAAETTLTSAEALQLGFIDEVISTDVVAMVKYQIAAAVLPVNKQSNITMSETKELKAEIKTGFDKLTSMFAALLKGKVVAAKVELQGGESVYTDTDSVDVGTKVFTDEAMTTPAPDGTHTLADGTTIETVNGEVTVVTPPTQAKTEAEIANEKIAELEAQLQTAKADLTAAKTEKEQFIAAAKAAKDEFEAFKNKVITGNGEIFEPAGADPKAKIENNKPGDWKAEAAKRRAEANKK